MTSGLFRGTVLSLALAIGAGPVAAVDYSDPTWPCIQRKVENLSVGLMWPHPLPETMDVAPYADIIDTLSLRRLSEDELAAVIDTYMAANPDTDLDTLGIIFNGVFEKLGSLRRELIAGIERYSEQQIALAQKIDAQHTEMAQLEAQDEPDFDRIDEIEAVVDWDERIYEDRVQALTYVCETPVLIEKRLYALAQLLLARAPD